MLAGVALGERVGARLRVGEHRVDGRDRVRGIAVEEGGEVPGDLEGVVVGDVGQAHRREAI